MREKPSIASEHDAQLTRLAWSSFVATIALVAVLGMARSAQALTLPVLGPVGTGAAAPPANEDPEAEAEDDEGEEIELEDEECEEEEEECEPEDGPEAPAECVLSSASASVSASLASDKVRLIVRYTSLSPTTVAVSSWLRGSKGPLALGGDKKHFARKGSFRQTLTLSEAQMAKVLAAKDFTVQLRPAGAPRYCNALLDRHLTVRHAGPGKLTWSDPEAGFRR
jgi:hypothetical protein